MEKASDVVNIGDRIKVQVIEIDDKGKVKVSHREFLEKPEGYVERPERARPEHQSRPDRSFNGPRRFKK